MKYLSGLEYLLFKAFEWLKHLRGLKHLDEMDQMFINEFK